MCTCNNVHYCVTRALIRNTQKVQDTFLHWQLAVVGTLATSGLLHSVPVHNGIGYIITDEVPIQAILVCVVQIKYLPS